MNGWTTLSWSEQNDVWDRFYRDFTFRPSVHREHFPGIDEPSPSETFGLPRAGAEIRLPSAEETRELEAATLAAFRACTPPGGRIYALDWQHECFWLDPHACSEWRIPIVPDGDYSIFLSRDFSWGLFCHPWEWTICAFGAPLLAAIGRQPPRLFTAPIRRR